MLEVVGKVVSENVGLVDTLCTGYNVYWILADGVHVAISQYDQMLDKSSPISTKGWSKERQ